MKHNPPLEVQQALEFRCSAPVTEILRLENKEDYPICPRCHISLEREYLRFCYHCGQKLGWKKFKKANIVYPRQSASPHC